MLCRDETVSLFTLTVYDFQVTVLFAVTMGVMSGKIAGFVPLMGAEAAALFGHKLSCVSTMELIGRAPNADPREILILTGKQLKREIGALWIRHLCACDILAPVSRVMCGLIGVDGRALRAILKRSRRLSVE